MKGETKMQAAGIRGLLVGFGVALAIGPAKADAIQWQTSLASAMSRAKAGNKLIMADFYTDW